MALKDTAGHWAENMIRKAIEDGLVQGYPDETFRPNKPINRAEFTALLVRGLNLKEEDELTFKDADGLPEWAVITSYSIHYTKLYELQ